MAIKSRQLVSCEGLGREEKTIMGNKLKKQWEELEGRIKRKHGMFRWRESTNYCVEVAPEYLGYIKI